MKWKPIETAPINVPILVCGSKRLMGPVVAWQRSNGEWLIETCSSEENIYPPRFWQFLPQLPAGLREAE